MTNASRLPPRIIGVDAARAVALGAMMWAHLTDSTSPWLYGFPSALFAFLAGVSMQLSMRATGGAALARERHQAMVRGAALLALHVVLTPLSGSITVVLGTFGACYLALACAPRWRTRTLAGLCAALMVVSALQLPLSVTAPPYPLFEWAALMVAGLIAARFLPRLPLVAPVGAACAVFGVWMRPLLDAHQYPFLNPNGHTGGLIALISEIGCSLAVLGLCLLLFSRWCPYPIQAMGRTPLSVYCLHVVTAALLPAGPLSAALSIVAAAALASVWLLFFPRGPLEQLLRDFTHAAARQDLPQRHSAKELQS